MLNNKINNLTSSSRALAAMRNRDFMKACRRVIAESGSKSLTVAEVTAAAASQAAPSYYLTFDYARRLVSEGQRGGARRTLRESIDGRHRGARLKSVEARRQELIDRVEEVRAKNPRLKEHHALARVLASGASSFFLSPEGARRLYTRMRSHINNN